VRARRLLIPAVLLAGGAAIAVAAALDSSEPAPPPELDARSQAALNRSGGTTSCSLGASTEGEDDSGFDIDAIAGNVEALRELEFESTPDYELLPGEEIDRRIEELLIEYTPRSVAETDERLLKLLGAIPADADLYELTTEGLEGEVAGLYVPETEELLVRSDGEPGVLERIIMAHELQHALADQRLGLPDIEVPDPARADATLAETALVEGDASLLMELYAAEHVGLSDLLGLSPGAIADADELGELPYFLQRQLLWAYGDGARFACALYRRGGWKAVDRAYANPPRASDQVMFPGRFGSRPVDPRDPGALEEPWTLLQAGELGAAPLMWLFEAPAGDPERSIPDPRAAARGWAGGEYALWERGGDSAVGIALAEQDDSRALCAGVAGWYAAAYPDERRVPPRGGEELVIEGDAQAAVLRCPRGEVRFGIAPELASARLLAG
jgi:hypothetical protein